MAKLKPSEAPPTTGRPGKSAGPYDASNRTDALQDHRAHLDVCRSCPIGAAHAGGPAVTYSAHYGEAVCPRCRRGTTRMIRDRVCVSCYNRERELASRRNARGNSPSKLRPIHRIHVAATVDGVAQRGCVTVAVDTFEAVMHTLRTTKGRIAFGFRGYDGGLRQMRLL